MSVGQEGIFFLQADLAYGFCRQIEYGLAIGKSDLQFENAQKLIAAVVKVYARPSAALSADNTVDRQFAAVALVARYRAGQLPLGARSQVEEPIPVDESRLILAALGGMKWTDPPLEPSGVMSLPNAFRQLQLSEKDGWREPQPKANEHPDEVIGKAVAEWFKDHSAKYRIQRHVVRETDARHVR